MRPIHLAIATGFVLALSCHSAVAQWKWRDAAGHVTASDLPPPSSVPEQNILSRPDPRHAANAPRPPAAASSPGGLGPRSSSANTDPELEARRKRAADEQKLQQKQAQESNDAARSDICARAQAQLAVLSGGQRMARATAQGEKEVLDDKGRADETQRANTIIASNCK